MNGEATATCGICFDVISADDDAALETLTDEHFEWHRGVGDA